MYELLINVAFLGVKDGTESLRIFPNEANFFKIHFIEFAINHVIKKA